MIVAARQVSNRLGSLEIVDPPANRCEPASRTGLAVTCWQIVSGIVATQLRGMTDRGKI